MVPILHAPLAAADLDDILTDLQQKNPTVAEQYATRFTDKAHFLAQYPESGRTRPELAPGVRSV